MKMEKSQQTKYRNTKDHKRLLLASICQRNGQLERKGRILRKV